MKALFKIILLVLTIGFGLISLFLLGDSIYRNVLLKGEYRLMGYTLWISTIFLIFCIFSVLFHVKSLKLYQTRSWVPKEIDTLDEGLTSNVLTNHQRIEVSLFLWIGNVLFTTLVLLFGIVLVIALQDSFPIHEFPKGFSRYLLVFGILTFGICLIIDVLRVKMRIKKIKEKVFKPSI